MWRQGLALSLFFKGNPMTKFISYYFLLAVVFTLPGCSREPQPIAYGRDLCNWCKMTIMDSRYGTELISKKGKIFKYDSIECLVNFTAAGEIKEVDIYQVLITDFTTPENFTEAKTAHYLISQNLPSPMGAYLTGFKNVEEAEKFRNEYDGRVLGWQEVVNEVAENK